MGGRGIEPLSMVLEAIVLPLNYPPGTKVKKNLSHCYGIVKRKISKCHPQANIKSLGLNIPVKSMIYKGYLFILYLLQTTYNFLPFASAKISY